MTDDCEISTQQAQAVVRPGIDCTVLQGMSQCSLFVVQRGIVQLCPVSMKDEWSCSPNSHPVARSA